MLFQRARTKEQIEDRKQEILEACKKLYIQGGYEAISMNEISKATSVSRASLYTYYSTKEEILLSLLQQCYLELEEVLRSDFESCESMNKEDFSELLARRWSENDLLIRLTSIHYITLEQKCSQEKLNDYKTNLRPFFETFDGGIKKYFPHLSREEIQEFGVLFFSLMNGLYFMTHLSSKQTEALKKGIPDYISFDFYEISKVGIYALMQKF